jgi:hypothetical protein
MADIVYDYGHVPTIKRFSDSRKFIRGLMGPFGSGKSSGCVIELVKLGAKQHLNGKRRSRFAVIRNTYQQLRDTTIKTVHQWVPPEAFGTWYKSEHRYVIDRLDPQIEIEILFRALDRPEHVSNLLSLELTGAWVNEAREVPWAVIKALQGRVGRYPSVMEGGCVDPSIILDTNPPDDESWFYDLFEVSKPETAELFRQPSGISAEAENLPFLPPNYYSNLLAGSDEDFIKVYVKGEYGFVRDGKPIYPQYVDSLHCRECSPVPMVPIKRGWDFGLTPACVFTQITPDGRFIVFDELTSEDIGIDAFGDAALLHTAQKYPGFKFEDYGDPAGEQKSQTDEKTCFEILRAKGVSIQTSEQDPTLRWESVRKPLSTLRGAGSQFVLDPKCKKLRKGFQGRYQFKRLKIAGAEARFQEVADKNLYSHPHDALQYVAVQAFGNALKSGITRKPLVYPKRAYA